MKTPPFLMSAALLFWGALAGFLPWAALLAIVLESSRLVKFRWEFSEADLNRIWDLCGLLFLGAGVILYNSEETKFPAYVFPQWFPFVFFPMMAAQTYGTTEFVSTRTLSWFLRFRPDSEWAKKRINFSYLYFAICLFGASTTSEFSGEKTPPFNWFFPGICALIGWALFVARPKRISTSAWTVLLAIAMSGGYVGQKALHEAQSYLENAVGTWISKLTRRHVDPKESRTRIGEIGDMKLSGRIVLRVKPDPKGSVPTLLREATYTSYRGGSWFAETRVFHATPAGKNDSFSFMNASSPNSGATIYQYTDGGGTILPLPLGTFEITNIQATVKTNAMGVVRVEDAPGLLSYGLSYSDKASLECSPTDSDMKEVSPEEGLTITNIANEIGLMKEGLSVEQRLHLINQFFVAKFKYSTYISKQHVDISRKKTPLQVFLEDTRSGHCEYFATATVLLARAASISARYATGFAVDTSSRSGDTYLVRERHGHAWAVIWDSKHERWVNFDTTPPIWEKEDAEHASFFEPLRDLWSRIWFEFSKWRYGKNTYQKYLVWALVPLILFLAWRVIFNKHRKRTQRDDKEMQRSRSWPGLDSELYLVEKKLEVLGFVRSPGETLCDWKNRLSSDPELFYAHLDHVLTLHYRYRFDPQGITADERSSLSQGAREWLTALTHRIDAAKRP